MLCSRELSSDFKWRRARLVRWGAAPLEISLSSFRVGVDLCLSAGWSFRSKSGCGRVWPALGSLQRRLYSCLHGDCRFFFFFLLFHKKVFPFCSFHIWDHSSNASVMVLGELGLCGFPTQPRGIPRAGNDVGLSRDGPPLLSAPLGTEAWWLAPLRGPVCSIMIELEGRKSYKWFKKNNKNLCPTQQWNRGNFVLRRDVFCPGKLSI